MTINSVSHPSLKQMGLRLNPKARRHRPTDTGPITNIAGSIDISMVRMTARNTTERSLIRTVPLIDGSTPIARLTGVARVNQHHRNTAHLRFIADVLAKLAETPIAVPGALRFPNPLLCAFTDARQIFEGKCTTSAFGFLNQLLCNPMIRIRLKTALLAAEVLQAPFRAFCADCLQSSATTLVALAYSFNLCATVLFTVAVGGKVRYPKIDTQDCVNIIWRWFIDIARYKEIELTLAKHQIAFALSGLQQPALSFTADKRNGLTTGNCPDRNRLPVKLERQNTVIISDAAVRPIAALCLAIQLVTITNFGKTTDHHLCRQAVVSLDALIDQLLQIILSKYLLFPRNAADLVTRGVGRFKRAFQGVGLFRRRLQLDLGNDFHILNYSTKVRRCQSWAKAAEAGRFLPRLKPVGFRA
jgi:hypothetical protein